MMRKLLVKLDTVAAAAAAAAAAASVAGADTLEGVVYTH